MPPPRTDRPLAGIALRLASVFLLAVMLASAKIAEARGAHLLEILFWRQALAVPVVLASVLPTAGLASLRTARPIAHARRMVVGLTGMAANFGAVLLLPLAEASTFGFTVPIFAVVLSALVLKEPTGPWRWAAVGIGFAGVAIALQPGGHHVSAFGAAVALTGAVLTATVTILIRDLSKTERAGTIVFWFTLTSLVPLGLALPFVVERHDAATYGLLVLLGVAGGAAQLCLTGALRLAPVAVVMPMDYSSLLWATLFGWWLYGALPTPATWVGAPIIAASGLVIVWRERVRHRENAVTAMPED
ncbi:DMT family transporter [Sphingomonas aracearum]|uniref:DMT family transporter n=1 Tax=Sphingomonas aracearum TaxID=2283317 RepID=A0A369VT13_9SPHN|nr:DMT family transporter [Sphingomonas aracearum]RDE05546.1 DMT family transporter [Sphingomonas aracearum]